MSSQIFWQEQSSLTDDSVAFDVVMQDKITGATITVHCVDENHADDLGRVLLAAGFNS